MKKGFTLIELLVVVLIIGILAAIALPQYTTAVEKARATEALALMGTIRYAGERYRLQMNQWPGNNLDYLDIEVPDLAGDNSYKSKFFTFSASGNGSGSTDKWTITATREGTAGNGGNGYNLKTVVETTGKATRSCTAGSGTNDAKICKAIASGSTANF